MQVRVVATLVVLVAAVGGCVIEELPVGYIDAPELVSVQIDVVELGPVERSLTYPDPTAAIAEIMPGDLVELRAVVIDADGRELPDEAIESIWLDCNLWSCDPSEAVEIDCDDSVDGERWRGCLSAMGDGRARFVAPALRHGWGVSSFRNSLDYLGIIGYDGRGAMQCLLGFGSRDRSLDGCAFVTRRLDLGPMWPLMVWGEQERVPVDVPSWQIPAGVLEQPANRPPFLAELAVSGDVEGQWQAPFPVVPVRAGDRLRIRVGYDLDAQAQQIRFGSKVAGASRVFFPEAPEPVFQRVYVTGALRLDGLSSQGPGPMLPSEARDYPLRVVDDANPGVARLIVVSYDSLSTSEQFRAVSAETHTIIEFEVLE